MKEIKQIDATLFHYIENILINSDLDTDKSTFKEIRDNLYKNKIFNPEEFAEEVFYVISVAGFKQTTAKKMCQKTTDYIRANPDNPKFDEMIKIYGNVNKINAMIKVWNNRKQLHGQFYSLNTEDEKLDFLGTLPHIGHITKYHIARNLGVDVVKYDIWIQRLGSALYGTTEDGLLVSNSKLNPKIREMCDLMFDRLVEDIREKRGYIDVVLWKACQQGLIHIKDNVAYFRPIITPTIGGREEAVRPEE